MQGLLANETVTSIGVKSLNQLEIGLGLEMARLCSCIVLNRRTF